MCRSQRAVQFCTKIIGLLYHRVKENDCLLCCCSRKMQTTICYTTRRVETAFPRSAWERGAAVVFIYAYTSKVRH
jgi:hypothetical protein